MRPAELLAELGRLGVTVETGDDGRPVLNGSFADDLLAEARDARWLFVWGLHGSTSGHRWYACTVCEEVQLLNHERPCGMRYRCTGRMVPAQGPAFQGVPRAGRHAS